MAVISNQTNVNQKILRQLEFYFSDSNIPRDKFLQTKIKENEEGYIDIDILLTFNRLKDLKATKQLIVQVSKDSSLLKCDEAGERIKRTTEIPKVAEFPNRAVFAMGWTPKGDEPTIDDLIDLFAPCGKVLKVVIRRDHKRSFRGSVFIEMESAEAAERVAADEFSITVKDENGKEIKKMLTTEPYLDFQKKIKNDPMAFGKDNFDPPKEKRKRSDKDDGDNRNKRKKMEDEHDGDGGKDSNNDNSDNNKRLRTENGTGKEEAGNKGESDEEELQYPSGVIIRVEDLPEGTSREDIREVMEEYGEITFIDLSRGDPAGYVRFSNPEDVKIALEKFQKDNKQVNGKDIKVLSLEGDKEKEYWINVEKIKAERKKNRPRGGGRGGRGGRGRGGGGRFKRYRGRGGGGGLRSNGDGR